jgi:hypothetical protein
VSSPVPIRGFTGLLRGRFSQREMARDANVAPELENTTFLHSKAAGREVVSRFHRCHYRNISGDRYSIRQHMHARRWRALDTFERWNPWAVMHFAAYEGCLAVSTSTYSCAITKPFAARFLEDLQLRRDREALLLLLLGGDAGIEHS